MVIIGLRKEGLKRAVKFSRSDRKSYSTDYFGIRDFRDPRDTKDHKKFSLENPLPKTKISSMSRVERANRTHKRELKRLQRLESKNLEAFDRLPTKKTHRGSRKLQIKPKAEGAEDEEMSDQLVKGTDSEDIEFEHDFSIASSFRCELPKPKQPFLQREYSDVLKVQKMDMSNNLSVDPQIEETKEKDKENLDLRVERRKPTLSDLYDSQEYDLPSKIF